MAFTKEETKEIETAVSTFLEQVRPPEHLRNQVDITYRIEGQSVEIIEVRPYWQDASRKIETPIAKATYVRTQDCWKIFWQRADMKWHSYDPDSEVDAIETFLALVRADEFHCFWG